jgi:hypothetical protein
VARLCESLPGQLRDTDCLTRPRPAEVLILTAGAPDAFMHLRRRLMALWDQSWKEENLKTPAPPLTAERVDVGGPEDAEPFLAAVKRWLAATD